MCSMVHVWRSGTVCRVVCSLLPAGGPRNRTWVIKLVCKHHTRANLTSPQFYISHISPQLSQDQRNVTSMCETGGDQIAQCTQLQKCLGDSSKLVAFQVGLSPGEQLVVPGGGSRLSRSESNCQELIGPWLAASRPSVSSHWHPEGGRGLVLMVLAAYAWCWLLGAFHLAAQGWAVKAVMPRICVPQGTSRRVAVDSELGSDDYPAQSTLSTRGGSEALLPGSHPLPSASLLPLSLLLNLRFSGDTKGFSSKSTELLKGAHHICELEDTHGQPRHWLFPYLLFCVFKTMGEKQGLNYVAQADPKQPCLSLLSI